MSSTLKGSALAQLRQFGMMNQYLVREDDGLTLIDTGTKGHERAILKAAEELGAPIRRIVLTHAHGDHVGSLDALHALLPAAEVLISERDARLLRGDLSLDPGEARTPIRGGLPAVSTIPTRLLQPGDQVGHLKAIAAPGHTPGQLAFLDERDGTLIAGDAYHTFGGVSTSAEFRLLFPLPVLATWHRPTALATARALAALTPTRLATGHGPMREHPGRAMQEAVVRAERQLSARSH